MRNLDSEQAKEVAEILACADGGCFVCALDLTGRAKKVWPEHDWYALVGKAGDWSSEEFYDDEVD